MNGNPWTTPILTTAACALAPTAFSAVVEALAKLKCTRALKPRGLREGVLKKAEDLNIFVHLKGKKEIKEHKRKIKKSDRKIGDRGGNPSAYMTTDDVVKINKVMAKTGTVDCLLEK
jgi:hypothetical protein